MKACFLGSCLLALFTVSCATASSPAPTECRLTVELRDGSRVVGTSVDKHYDFDSTVLGAMKLPLKKIQLLEALSRTNQVKLTTVGGDSLVVSFNMQQVRVKTSYGEVKLPVAMIKSMRVTQRGGPGRPTDGLVGLWSGDGNATDSVAGNSGTLVNVSFTDGVAGQAFSFAPNNFPYGTYTGVQVPDQPAFALTQALTIEGWVRPRGDGYCIFFRGDHRPGLDPYCLSMQGNHSLRFQITGENNETTAYVETSIPYCQWTHVAAVLDGNADTISLFTNGVLAAQARTNVRPLADLLPGQFPGIGVGNVNDGGNNFPFVGDIDEIALYNRALSPDEIHAIYAEHAANAAGTCALLPIRSVPPVRFPARNPQPIYDSQ